MMNTIATQTATKLVPVMTSGTQVNETSSVPSNLVGEGSGAAARPLANPTLDTASTDVLVQLRANLAQLDDLHGRLKHLMGELSYLLRKPEF